MHDEFDKEDRNSDSTLSGGSDSRLSTSSRNSSTASVDDLASPPGAPKAQAKQKFPKLTKLQKAELFPEASFTLLFVPFLYMAANQTPVFNIFLNAWGLCDGIMGVGETFLHAREAKEKRSEKIATGLKAVFVGLASLETILSSLPNMPGWASSTPITHEINAALSGIGVHVPLAGPLIAIVGDICIDLIEITAAASKKNSAETWLTESCREYQDIADALAKDPNNKHLRKELRALADELLVRFRLHIAGKHPTEQPSQSHAQQLLNDLIQEHEEKFPPALVDLHILTDFKNQNMSGDTFEYTGTSHYVTDDIEKYNESQAKCQKELNVCYMSLGAHALILPGLTAGYYAYSHPEAQMPLYFAIAALSLAAVVYMAKFRYEHLSDAADEHEGFEENEHEGEGETDIQPHHT